MGKSGWLLSVVAAVILAADQPVFAQVASGPPVFAGIFGSRNLTVENPNNPGANYTMVQHVNDFAGYDALEYDAGRGWGFEVIYPDLDGPYDDPFRGDGEAGRFGPMDDSPNNRGAFANTLPDRLYDSFIGFKNFATTCDANLFPDSEDPLNEPCSNEIDPDGGIFRVDVPNGLYAFVGVFGDAENTHAHRILAEDGGEGPPIETDIGDHVVLVNNHDQAQYDIGEADLGGNLGEGVYALVGFGDKRPPEPRGSLIDIPVPRFVPQDENGLPILDDGVPIEDAPPRSPVLEVTQGYIRFHLLQGNSNDGPGGGRDANGGDIVLLEVYPVTEGMLGDYNNNGELDAGDLDLQAEQIVANPGDPAFDLNGDNVVDFGDRQVWINDLKNTWMGDANLDGEFNSSDQVQKFVQGKYEQDVVAGWTDGDSTGDMRFNSGDMVADFVAGGYEKGPKALGPNEAVSAVPEPSGMGLLLVGLIGLARRVRRRRS